MRKAATLEYQVKQPCQLTVNIVTQFTEINPFAQLQYNQHLASLFLYTKNAVYQGKIMRSDINSQLAWSNHSLMTLMDSLSGRKRDIEVRFSELNNHLTLICQIQQNIRIQMFQICLTHLKAINPLAHMKKTTLNYKKLYISHQIRQKQEEQKIKEEIKEIRALSKQIQQQTQIEISHLKRNFLDVINQCKKQLRKYMKPAICQIQQEQEETVTRNRVIRKVDREKLEAPRNHNKREENVQEEPQKDFDSIFGCD